jgi:hypothetical protein
VFSLTLGVSPVYMTESFIAEVPSVCCFNHFMAQKLHERVSRYSAVGFDFRSGALLLSHEPPPRSAPVGGDGGAHKPHVHVLVRFLLAGVYDEETESFVWGWAVEGVAPEIRADLRYELGDGGFLGMPGATHHAIFEVRVGFCPLVGRVWVGGG